MKKEFHGDFIQGQLVCRGRYIYEILSIIDYRTKYEYGDRFYDQPKDDEEPDREIIITNTECRKLSDAEVKEINRKRDEVNVKAGVKRKQEFSEQEEAERAEESKFMRFLNADETGEIFTGFELPAILFDHYHKSPIHQDPMGFRPIKKGKTLGYLCKSASHLEDLFMFIFRNDAVTSRNKVSEMCQFHHQGWKGYHLGHQYYRWLRARRLM